MANSEAGWTKEFPEAGTYWLRSVCDPTNAVAVVILNDRIRFSNGATERFSPKAGYEFLGPITPSDAEQLMELRKTARRALKLSNALFEHFMGKHACGDFTCACGDCGLCEFRRESKAELKTLSAVLNPKQPEKETQ